MNIKTLAASALAAATMITGAVVPAEAASLRDQAIVVVDHYVAQSQAEFEAEDWTAFCRSEGTQFYVDAMYGMSTTLGRKYKAQVENNIRICKEEGYSVTAWPRAQWPIDIRPQTTSTWTDADDAAFGTNFNNNSFTRDQAAQRCLMNNGGTPEVEVDNYGSTTGYWICRHPAGYAGARLPMAR